MKHLTPNFKCLILVKALKVSGTGAKDRMENDFVIVALTVLAVTPTVLL